MIVTSYFEKRRAFATGIAVCGSGIGTAILSPLFQYLIELMGWKGAMLVISALMLLCCLFGILFRPLPPVVETPQEYNSLSDIDAKERQGKSEFNLTVVSSIIEEEPEEDADECIGAMSQSAPRLSMPQEKEIRSPPANCKPAKSMCSVQLYLNDLPIDETKQRSHSFSPGFLYRKDAFYSGSLLNIPNYSSDDEVYQKREKKANCCLFRWFNCSEEMIDNFSEMIDLSLLSNHIFLIFSTSNFLCSIGYHIPFIYLKVVPFSF